MLCSSLRRLVGLDVRDLVLLQHIVNDGILLFEVQPHIHQDKVCFQLWMGSPDESVQFLPLGGLQPQLRAGGIDALVDTGVADDVRDIARTRIFFGYVLEPPCRLIRRFFLRGLRLLPVRRTLWLRFGTQATGRGRGQAQFTQHGQIGIVQPVLLILLDTPGLAPFLHVHKNHVHVV